jgi:choline-sulfatase
MDHQFSRRDLLLSSAASVALAQRPAEPAKKPNFVFFMPETLRAESIGCYGHPLVRTPNLDRLANEGVRFTQCHVQHTVCTPSRCSLMTGWPVHVRGHRSLFYLLQPDEPNLFRYLRQKGYDVHWYGKNDLLAAACFPDSVTAWGSPGGRGKPAGNPWPFGDRRYYSFHYGAGGDRRETADYACVQAAIRILERAERPFCIYLPLLFVHPPYTAPADFHEMCRPQDLPPLRPVGLARKPNFHEAIRRTRHLTQLTSDDLRAIQAIYLGMVSYSDWLLGELMEAMERTGHAADTCLFAFSDHGDWGGDYGLVEKWPSALDDVLTRVPLIARVPGMAQGHAVKEIIELFDVMPTCLELAGIGAQHTHFARSLVPQLRGEPGDPQRAAFAEGGYNVYERRCFERMADVPDPKNIYYPKVALQNEHPETITRAAMIRTLGCKLVMRPEGPGEFYDLKKDALELHNVYGQRSYAEKQGMLLARLLDWYVRTSDVAPPQHDPRGLPPLMPGTH